MNPAAHRPVRTADVRSSVRVLPAIRHLWSEHKWVSVGTLWAATLVLAYVGAWKQLEALGEPRSPFEPLYRALQLFLLDDSGVASGPIVAWELEVARFLAPAVAASTALAAILALFHEQVAVARLRVLKNHAVVCGLGRRGVHLVRDFRSRGDAVVAIEPSDDSDGIEASREMGATVLIGSAADSALLRKAGAHRARCVVAVSDSDGTNLDIAVRTCQLAQKERSPGADSLLFFAHVVDQRLSIALGRHPMFEEAAGRFELRTFNVFENSARLLHRECPLDRPIDSQRDRPVHLVLGGFGQMGEAVAVQAARVVHRTDGRKLRITVLDKEAEARERAFIARFPNFSQVCEAVFLQEDLTDPGTLDRIGQWAREEGYSAAIVLAFDDDARCLSTAFDLVPRIADTPAPILVRMSEETGLAALLASHGAGEGESPSMRPFGMRSSTCRWDLLLKEDLDKLAKAIHYDFVERRRGEGRSESDPSMSPWERCDPSLKDSSRQQADHIPVKLRAIGCYSAAENPSVTPVTEFSPQEVESLAMMEHARWNVERFLGGWSWGPQKDVGKKTHPHLVAWEELPENVREYDREAVRNIPHLLGLIGERTYRREG